MARQIVLFLLALLPGCRLGPSTDGECSAERPCASGEICEVQWCVRSPDAMVPEPCRMGMVEVCNGDDDDCDGDVDENLSMEVKCFGDASGALDPAALDGVGNCRAGWLRCVAGEEVCEGLVLPRADDFCGGGDADCDGTVDEDGATEEVCNREDDDCDGRTDEAGVAEMCDGVDNDCDGDVDEEWAALGELCGVGVGECRREGIWACSDDGTERACVDPDGAAVTAGPEVVERCDGFDNDCDGEVDEDFGRLGRACEVGVGVCRVLGEEVCGGDGAGTRCGAVAGAPGEEVCDAANEDEDCDGVAEEACACGLVDQGDVIEGFGERTSALPPLVMPADPGGLEGSCTAAGLAIGGSERDELVVRWRPGDEARLALISVWSVDFDPQVYLRSPCAPPRGAAGAVGEQGCALDIGVWGDEGRATMMVAVPEGEAEGSVVVEAQGGAVPEGRFAVRVSDPTGVSVRGGTPKRLMVGAAELGGADLCRKHVARAGVGGLPVFDELEPADAPEPGWQERRFCVDNDGWRRSVRVAWDELVAGVGAEMLPEAAEEAGDWWSVEVPGIPEPPEQDALQNGFDVIVQPWDEASACAANTARLVARLTCSAAAPMVRAPCVAERAGSLVCEGVEEDHNTVQCFAGLVAGLRVPRRTLSLSGLRDGGCRTEGATLVLHVGVIRDAGLARTGCTDPASMQATCGGDGNPGEAVPPEQGFRYRLRVRAAD